MKLQNDKSRKIKSIQVAFKRIGCFLIILSLLVPVFTFKSSAAELPPVSDSDTINIGIGTDVHIARSDSQSTKTIEALFRKAIQGFYTASGNHLDAVAFTGDLTDNGYVDELQTFRSIVDEELDQSTLFTAVMGNHEFYKHGAGFSIDDNPGTKEDIQNDFVTNIKTPIEGDISVKGVHILAVSPDNELDSYRARESFLRQKIADAAAENPENPIIIIAHKPVKYTVMSSGEPPKGSYGALAADWSEEFLDFMKQYPQIIYFSGHAHDDLRNEKNIYQQDFTSIQAGVVSAESASTGLLVSIDSDKVVTINRINFSAGTYYDSWTIDIPKVIQSKGNFQYRKENVPKNINLTMAAEASELYVNWFNTTAQTGKVQFSEKTNLVGNELTTYEEIDAFSSDGSVDSTVDSLYYYNHARLTNLRKNTEYAYRVGNENGWSEYSTFTTPASDGDFSFVFTADPQINGSGESSDIIGWRNTMSRAAEYFPNAQFMLSAGDQVEVASNSLQYDGFFSPPELKTLPIATVVGNHDFNSKLYSQHFAYSNVSEDSMTKSTGEYSGDYWFVRNNTLFMMLNSNEQDTRKHVNFMQQAILDAGDDVKWKVVMFHHSVFSTAGHAGDSDIIARRKTLPSALSDLQIDVALMGHDHIFCRTFMMDGVIPDTTSTGESETVNPEPGLVLYITGNSASGGKYYDMEYGNADYAAKTYQNYTRYISNVDVSDTALTITSYNATDMEETDRYTLIKNQAPAADTLKPYLFLPTENKVALDNSFDKMAGVSAIDNVDGDLTDQILVTGEVDTSTEGTYSLTYTVTDTAGNTATAIREIVVRKQITGTGGLYFGIDIRNGKLANEANSALSYSTYTASSGYVFETDNEIHQTVLQGPEKGNLIIEGLNLAPLDNQYTIETYIKIPSELSLSSPGSLDSYDIFQFDDQNINLVGFPGNTYFGSGRYSHGDADVTALKNLPVDQWIHVVATAQDEEQVLYVNGVEFAKNTYKDLNITSTKNDELILGGTYSNRSGLIKYASFRIYGNFTNAGLAEEMYQAMLDSLSADYSEVDAAIARIPANLALYTEESVANLQAALDAVDRNKTQDEQTLVDEYAAAIEEARLALTYHGTADYSAVTAALAKIPANLSLYTEESVNALSVAQSAVVPGKDTGEQSIVDGYAQAIEDAISALEYKAADYTAVDAALAMVPSDLSPYASESVIALNAAIAAVSRDKNITEQSIVDGYAQAIENAISGLAIAGRTLYFGIDIQNGNFKNEAGSAVTSVYNIPGDYGFETDAMLNRTVMRGPRQGNMGISGLNLAPLDNQFSIETYLYIPSTASAYDVFQFDDQNVNLVGLSGATYFGAGKCSDGDADVVAAKNLPVDQWVHVICTAKEGAQVLYVNGKEFASETYDGLNTFPSSADELIFGGTSSGRSGEIKFASFRIYREFMTPGLAENAYNTVKNGLPADYTSVDAALAKIPAELSLYTEDSVAVLQTAVAGIVRGKTVVEQALVNGYAAAIESAIAALIERGAPDQTVDLSEIHGVTAPVTGEEPSRTIEESPQYTGTISWTPEDAPFEEETRYTATITLAPKSGFTLEGVTENFFTVDGALTVTNTANSGVVTASFPATDAQEPTPVKKAITVGSQQGTILSGTAGTATYSAVFSNIADDTAVTVIWSDHKGYIDAAPNGIYAVASDVRNSLSLITITTDETAETGDYYFVLSSDEIFSGPVPFTIGSEPVKTYTVTFKNWDGSILKTETVKSGAGATAPAEPTRSGYTFTGWDASYKEITEDLTVTAQFKKDSPGKGSSGSSDKSKTPVIPAGEYHAVISGSGVSQGTQLMKLHTASSSASVILFENPLAEGKQMEITVPSIPEVSNYSLEIPVPSLSRDQGAGTLNFSTEFGSLTISDHMLSGSLGQNGNQAEITIGDGDKTSLTESVRTLIGNRPLVNLNLTIDGVKTDWNNPGAPVTVSIPYSPTAEELENPEGIGIWYLDGSRNAFSVPNGHYDAASGTVIFTTTHFSDYGVGYHNVNFSDIASDKWYGKAVSFVAARGIATGTGNGSFAPAAKLTRGEFLVMLMRAYSIAPVTDASNNFADAGNTYYTDYLAKAKQAGIADGIGNNRFAPGKEITRQEMLTMLYNTLKTIDQLPESNAAGQLGDYTDAAQVAGWAENAVTHLIGAGTISGNNGQLSPLGAATRAEMAQVLYKLLWN